MADNAPGNRRRLLWAIPAALLLVWPFVCLDRMSPLVETLLLSQQGRGQVRITRRHSLWSLLRQRLRYAYGDPEAVPTAPAAEGTGKRPGPSPGLRGGTGSRAFTSKDLADLPLKERRTVLAEIAKILKPNELERFEAGQLTLRAQTKVTLTIGATARRSAHPKQPTAATGGAKGADGDDEEPSDTADKGAPSESLLDKIWPSTTSAKTPSLPEAKAAKAAPFRPEPTIGLKLKIQVQGPDTKRLANTVVNTTAKDYRLIQSPRPGDEAYYILSDRSEDSSGPVNIGSRLRIFRIGSRRGPNAGEDAFSDARLVSGLPAGDLIGFDMRYTDGRYHVYYSHAGDIYHSSSADGIAFSGMRRLGLNTATFERDPAISADGRWLAFASNRWVLNDPRGMGRGFEFTRVYLARSNGVTDFQAPIELPDSLNVSGQSFPVFLTHGTDLLLLFQRSPDSKTAQWCSSRIHSGRPQFPVAIQFQGTFHGLKYISISQTAQRGLTIFAAHRIPGNSYDQVHMGFGSVYSTTTKPLQ